VGTVAFGATAGTDYQAGNGTSGPSPAAQTLSIPSGAAAGDYVWILRHHAASNSNMSAGPGTNGTIFSDGYIASGAGSSVGYYANGSTALMGTYRKVQGGDGNWTWTPAANVDFTWSTIRFSGADPTTPFVGGTTISAVDAGAGLGSGGPGLSFTVGNAVAGDMGVVVICCNSATAPTASGSWVVTTLRSGATRNIYMARRAYTGTVTGDSVTLTFGGSVSWVSRHGVIKAAPGTQYTQSVAGTITASSTLSTGLARLVSGLGGTITGAGSIRRQINKVLASPTQDSFTRVTVVGDSISEGTQVLVGNRWMDLLFGSQGTISNGVWWNGAGSGVPFPGKRIYSATFQGDSVIETTNRAYPNAKTDVSADGLGRTTDLLIICLGANDELDALPGGITAGDDTNPAHAFQWFEDNVVQLANGGIQSGTVGANPGGLNNLPKAKFVLVVGQWQWRAAQTLAGITGNVPTDHTRTLARLQAAVTRISALPHVTRAAYVHVGTHASLGKKVDNVTFGTNVAVADGTDGAGGTYAIGGASDRIHPNATGQASVYVPAIRYGIDLVTTNPTGGVTGSITATGSVPSTLKVRALAVAGIITASSTFNRVVAYTRSFGGSVAAAGGLARTVVSPPANRLRGLRGSRRPRTSRRTRRQ
jgi:hypothetical protein